MERTEFTSILEEVFLDQLGDTPNTQTPLSSPPPPSPPPLFPAELDFNGVLQIFGSHSGTSNELLPFEEVPHVQTPAINAAPFSFQPGHQSSQSGAYSQGQIFQSTAEDNVLVCAPALVGVLLYEAAPAAAPLKSSSSTENQRIKKPLNAFMLFLKEQRSNLPAALKDRCSKHINTILGEKWKSLPECQQAKYFQQANLERHLHRLKYPDWSFKSNYGKKKRERTRDPATAAVPASKDTQEAKRLCVRALQTEPPSSEMTLTESQ